MRSVGTEASSRRASSGGPATETAYPARARERCSRVATPGSSSTMRMCPLGVDRMAESSPAIIFAGNLYDGQEQPQTLDCFHEIFVGDRLGDVDAAPHVVASLDLPRIVGG